MDVVFYFHPAGLPSYGELQQAIGFAADLRKAGYRTWFLTPESLSAQLTQARLEVVAFEDFEIAQDIIDSIDPAIIIACEIFGMDQEAMDFLSRLHQHIATMDGTTLGMEIASDPFCLPLFRKTVTLPPKLFSFRPCPVNDIKPDTSRVFHWAAYPETGRIRRKPGVYREQGLDPRSKTVLLAIASWAEFFTGLDGAPFQGVAGYHDELVKRLADGLDAWGEPVQLVVVCNGPLNTYDNGRVSIRTVGILPYPCFDHLLSSCDLIVTDNIIQASLSKAIVAGTPHLVIENRIPSRLSYSSNIFPLAQLFPEKRAFSKIVDTVEFTDELGLFRALTRIHKLGYANGHRRRARSRYLERLRDLPGPVSILQRIVGSPRPLVMESRSETEPNLDIVFYIEIWFSFGEREHALSLANQLQATNYRPRFVVDYRVAEHIRSAGFEPVAFHSPLLGVRAVRQINPALIIGCELFNLSNLSVKGLMGLGIPVATMDGTSMGIEINSDPFHHPKLTRELLLPEDYYAFRPVPVNDAAQDSDRIFHFNLFPEAERAAKNKELYAQLELDPDRKTVMLPIALWAVTGSMLFDMASYHRLLVDRIIDALQAVGLPIDLMVVGLDEVGRSDHGLVRVHQQARLPYQQYDHILCSCDAVLSDNIIQTSIAKAFVIGGPHLVIQNLVPSEVPFPCNIFPLKLLFPAERAYAQAVEVAEFGDPKDIERKLIGVLDRGWCDRDRKLLRQAYMARLEKLSSPAAKVDRILSEEGERRLRRGRAS